MTPPFEWNRGAGTDAWATGGNWVGDTAPTINADVLFADAPTVDDYVGQGYGYQSPLTVEALTGLQVNALWFETGREYTVAGGPWATFALGGALAHDGANIITSLNSDSGAWQSEHNVIARSIAFSLPNTDWTATIASFSSGGFRIHAGLIFSKGNLRQRGGGAMHLAGGLRGTATNPGNLTIATDAGHMILSGNSPNWKGQLTVKHGFLVATANNALGSTTTTSNSTRSVVIDGTSSGSTLAFRPKFVGPGLNNSAGMNYTTAQTLTVSGTGYQRPWGSADPHDPYSKLNLRPVGAIYNDGGNNSFEGNIRMVGDTWFGSRHGVLTLNGLIFEAQPGFRFTKVGHGAIELGEIHSWSGSTVLREGVLRLGGVNSLPKNSVVHFEGGILELGGGNFSRTLGTWGNERIIWASGRAGGFSAFGGDRTVTLNNGAMLTWGGGGFVGNGAALLLSSAYADSKIVFQNPINLGSSAYREIRVERGVSPAAHAVLTGQISGSQGGVLKTGLGTLWLNNNTNNYRHITTIREGVLGGYVPSLSRIDFDGGVLGIDRSFTRSLGTAAQHIRWLAGRDGGFASYSGNRIVTIGLWDSVVTIGQANFVSPESYLIFGAYDARGTVIFNNQLGLVPDLYGAPPEKWGVSRIRVIQNRLMPVINVVTGLTTASVIFSQEFYTPNELDWSGLAPQALIPTKYSLYFEGDGRADITSNNASWLGNFIKTRGAQLVLSGTGTVPFMDRFHAYHGGSIVIDNSTHYVAGRVGAIHPQSEVLHKPSLSLHSGAFTYIGNASTHALERFQDLELHLGANRVSLLSGTFGDFSYSTAIQFRQLDYIQSEFIDGVQQHERPTLNFTTNSSAGFNAPHPNNPNLFNRHMISFLWKPAETGGILPYATINGSTWARTTQSLGNLYYLTSYQGYETGDETTWDVSKNVSPSADQTLTTARYVNSMRLYGGRTINLGSIEAPLSLHIDSGGLLSIGSSTAYIKNGGITATKGGDLYAHIYNTATIGLDISSMLALFNGGRFIKTGPGTLRLSGDSIVLISGGIHIHEGTLALSKTGETGKVLTSKIIVGDHAGVDILRLDNHQQILSMVDLTLRGGHPDPARFLMAEGILRYNGINGSGVGIRQTINNLHIEGRGVIDFRGGEVGRANFLIINGDITFGAESKLFIRNYYEYEDYILIRRNGAGLVNLDNIVFEGYGPAIMRSWDDDYYQITPNPEPATYGAILGIVGIGIVMWRKKRRRAASGIYARATR